MLKAAQWLANASIAAMSRFLQHDVPEVHHEHRVLGSVDVAEHVSRHGHDIGDLTGLERPHFRLDSSSFADSRVPDCNAAAGLIRDPS